MSLTETHRAAGSLERDSSPSGTAWDLLLDGAIPAACAMVEAAVDDHTKQHALGALTVALQQASARLQVGSPSPALHTSWQRTTHKRLVKINEPCEPN